MAAAAACCDAGLTVAGLSPTPADAPWVNTYGIWEDELRPLGLTHLVARRWTDTVAFMDGPEIRLNRVYGLLDNARLQAHLLEKCERRGMVWHTDSAASIKHGPDGSTVTTGDEHTISARVVVDASGHKPIFVEGEAMPPAPGVAWQAAYGLVGKFSAPPVAEGRMVLMDYRADHLSEAERREGPPTFLYAFGLGDGVHFVEETSLAAAPAVPLDLLEDRLHRRLAHMGVAVTEIQHIERCLFPMNMPLPRRDQPVIGFGGAASMVHPATGYQVGAALTRAPALAQALAAALANAQTSQSALAKAGWGAVWSADLLRKQQLYLFGLQNVLGFDLAQTQQFFSTFFRLPPERWHGYLSNTLSTGQLMATMLRLFLAAPGPVRRRLAASVGGQVGLLRRVVRP